jgi:hypothetical protein
MENLDRGRKGGDDGSRELMGETRNFAEGRVGCSRRVWKGCALGHSQIKATHSAAVTVQNMTLPSSGMNLTGKASFDDGATVTRGPKPVD